MFTANVVTDAAETKWSGSELRRTQRLRNNNCFGKRIRDPLREHNSCSNLVRICEVQSAQLALCTGHLFGAASNVIPAA